MVGSSSSCNFQSMALTFRKTKGITVQTDHFFWEKLDLCRFTGSPLDYLLWYDYHSSYEHSELVMSSVKTHQCYRNYTSTLFVKINLITKKFLQKSEHKKMKSIILILLTNHDRFILPTYRYVHARVGGSAVKCFVVLNM